MASRLPRLELGGLRISVSSLSGGKYAYSPAASERVPRPEFPFSTYTKSLDRSRLERAVRRSNSAVYCVNRAPPAEPT